MKKKIFLVCIIATFLWGLLAHGYMMTGFYFSHDSLDGLYAGGAENAHKIELGRILAPAYRYLIRGLFAVPWLTTLLAFLWIALAVWILVSVLDIQSVFLTVLISGLMTVNVTVTALAGTFIHDLDQNMFGMMMGCLAVLFWKKRPRGWMLWGSIAAAICLGMYQSFISMTIGLIMLIELIRLLKGEKVSVVLRNGLEGAAVVLLGSMLFFLMTKAITAGMNIPLAERENSLSALSSFRLAALPSLLGGLYANFFAYFREMSSSWLFPQAVQIINILLFAFAAAALIGGVILRKGLTAAQKGMIVLIVLLFPLGLNICYVLTSGLIHHLMQYAFVLFYVLCLLLADHLHKSGIRLFQSQPMQWLCSTLVILILWSGVQTANTHHFKKASAFLSTNARMTTVYSDMLYAGYIPGRTPLLVKGMLPVARPDGFEGVNDIHGAGWHNTITDDPKSIRSYFTFILGDNARFVTQDERTMLLEDPYVNDMPRYPEDGYIDFIEDVMIVNLF